MNRKALIFVTLAVALSLFAFGTWFVSRSTPAQIASPAPVEQIENLVRNYSPVMGLEDAPVTIVEFFDPACEACRAFYPVLKQILAEYPDDVRVVLRYTPFHGDGSELAIKVLEAARMQDVFIPVKEALLENQQIWASHGAPRTDRIMEIAAAAGLDLDAAAGQIKSPSVIAVLNQDRADVEAFGVRQTPTFYVNGRPLPEFGAQQLIALVGEEIAAAASN